MKRLVAIPFLLSLFPAASAAPDLFAIMPGAPSGTKATASSVKSQALLDTTAISAGKPFTLAVTLTTNTGYHIYWSNPGDSGLATRFKLNLPPGFTAEPLAFPLPSRFVQPGDITGYGYTGATTFLFTITPPNALKAPGDPAPLSLTANWLCCNKDQCVPGSAMLEIPLKLGDGQPANQPLFTAARAEIPTTAKPAALKSLTPIDLFYDQENPKTHQLGFTLEWNQRYAPQRVEIFPENVEGLKIDRIIIQPGGGNAFTRVSFHAHIMAGQKLSTDKLNVLVTCNKPDPNAPVGARGGRGDPAWFSGAAEIPGSRIGFIVPIDLRGLIADNDK